MNKSRLINFMAAIVPCVLLLCCVRFYSGFSASEEKSALAESEMKISIVYTCDKFGYAFDHYSDYLNDIARGGSTEKLEGHMLGVRDSLYPLPAAGPIGLLYGSCQVDIQELLTHTLYDVIYFDVAALDAMTKEELQALAEYYDTLHSYFDRNKDDSINLLIQLDKVNSTEFKDLVLKIEAEVDEITNILAAGQ